MSTVLVKKILRVSGLLFATFVVLILDQYLQETDLGRVTNSLIIITALYIILRVVFEVLLRRSIEYSKTRYSLRKMLRIVFFGLSTLALFTVWVENTESLIVTYGLFSAGIALAIQDTIKNFIGGVTIYLMGLFQVGDRVEIDGVSGDVIDINFNYTTLLEIKNWINGDQPTGRLIYIPNAQVSARNVYNFTKDHEFIWEEVVLPLTYGSDWRKARELILTYLSEVQADEVEHVESQLHKLGKKYYLEQRSVKPSVYVIPTDNWIDLRIRFISSTFERRETANTINEKIIELLEEHEDISIASQTVRVYGSQAADA